MVSPKSGMIKVERRGSNTEGPSHIKISRDSLQYVSVMEKAEEIYEKDSDTWAQIWKEIGSMKDRATNYTPMMEKERN